jgi:flavin reductase (DIM6/NTAB) family NADH-FMN oxidoreductase RutF
MDQVRPTFDSQRLRRVLGSFATGVTVISTGEPGQVHGMTANAFMSGSLDPPLCIVSVARAARMHEFLERYRHYGVNILARGQEDYVLHFAGRPKEELSADFAFVGSTPLLASAHARIAAEIVAAHDCGDHTLFIGRIVHVDCDEREPLVLHRGRYGGLALKQVAAAYPVTDFW